jgi:hypothetical protein
MVNYKWSFLELFANGNELKSVRYLLSGTDGQATVESSGNHAFTPGLVNKQLSEIVELDLVQWIEKDTTQDGVNLIKLAVENQINAIESPKKVEFPWLAGTFTIE